jgi:4-hydroxy-2-oxoheptanedioate aldolase
MYPCNTKFASLLCAAILLLGAASAQNTGTQGRARINRLIEQLEQGKPAISGEHWIFVDHEHGPYLQDKLEATLRELATKKNDRGQQALTSVVRIPMEGDQDFRWAIKQVLERGAMSIMVPQVDNKEQALKMVQAMRYPQRKQSEYPYPTGRRGFAAAPPTWGIKALDYIRLADVWPLNPEGELFALPQLETPEAIKNINEILDVPGVPGVFIGPNDLSMNLGVGPWSADGQAFSPPETVAAIRAVAKACVAKKKFCGVLARNEAETRQYIADGFKIIYTPYDPKSRP